MAGKSGPVFPANGKNFRPFSSEWKNFRVFSSEWKIFFHWVENFPAAPVGRRGEPVAAGMQNGPPGRRAVRREVSLGDYFLPFLPEPEVAGAVAAGSWVLGWMASMTGVAMKTEA